MPDTEEGVCRACDHRWPVPRTPIKLVKLPNGKTGAEGLDPCCPSCGSFGISWLYAPEPTRP